MKLPIDYTTLNYKDKKVVRQLYIEKQKGKCYHCGCLLSGPPSKEVTTLPINNALFPKGFFDYPVHLHHNHETGLTIGAVHCECNAVLWQYNGE